MRDCSYRIIKYGNSYYVEEKWHTYLLKKPYWKIKESPKFCPIEFDSLLEAEEYVKNEKIKDGFVKTVVEYL